MNRQKREPFTPREVKAEAKRFLRSSGALPPLAAMSVLIFLVAAACKTVVSAFFALPSIDFIAASSTAAPETPFGSVLTEQMTPAANAALDSAGALAGDLLMLAALTPLAAGLLLCVIRAVREETLFDGRTMYTPEKRGLSPFSAGGLGHFFASADAYRRASALGAVTVLRCAFHVALAVLPIWAVSERGGRLAFLSAFMPESFPFLPTACALSAIFVVLGLYSRARNFAAAPLYVSDPALTLRQAAKRSAETMRGHKAEAAALMLSFAGWWAVGFFTLGIVAAIYVLPYYLCCHTVFLKQTGIL